MEASSPPKPGPDQRLDAKVLSQFDTRRKSYIISPKKEYVRCKLIRGHKRAIRQIINSQTPKTTIHKFEENDQTALTLWHLMKQVYENNQEEFKLTCKTESGPITDGRAKRNKDALQSTEKSFNSKFCKTYFESRNIRESFSLYLDLVFCTLDPKVLNEKFEFYCCREASHSLVCLEKWASLQDFLKNSLLLELGCEPISLPTQYLTLPGFDVILGLIEDS